MILLVDRYSAIRIPLLNWYEIYFYLAIKVFEFFRNQKKQVCRFAMVSQSKSSTFLHVVEQEQRGVMVIAI
jgi:hypothetical protein